MITLCSSLMFFHLLIVCLLVRLFTVLMCSVCLKVLTCLRVLLIPLIILFVWVRRLRLSVVVLFVLVVRPRPPFRWYKSLSVTLVKLFCVRGLRMQWSVRYVVNRILCRLVRWVWVRFVRVSRLFSLWVVSILTLTVFLRSVRVRFVLIPLLSVVRWFLVSRRW